MKLFLIFLLVLSVVLIFLLRRRAIYLETALDGLEREKQTIYSFMDRVGTNITTNADTDATMELIVDFAQEITKADAAALFVRDRGGNTIRTRVVRGFFPPLHRGGSDKLLAKRKYVEDIVAKMTVEWGEGLIGRIAKEGKPVLSQDVSKDPRLADIEQTAVKVRDFIAIPLLVRGESLGVLVLVNKREDGPFGEEDERILVAVADQAAVTLDLVRLYKVMADQQRFEQELELAKTFQFLLLPHAVPDIQNVTFAEFYRPAKEVGGDYYDFIEVDEDHIGIAVADVAGKGIPGALIMASVRACLRAEALRCDSPKKVLQRVNDEVARDTKDGVFVTMTYGILNVRTGIFRFCRAGHEPVICCNDDGKRLTTHTPEGIALGLMVGEIFNVTEEKELDLSKDKLIVLYTDGVVEAMNGSDEEYGESRFHDMIRNHSGSKPGEIISSVVADIENFTRGLPQHDDMTLVVMGWKGADAQAAHGIQASTA